jgi:hypothetical protein
MHEERNYQRREMGGSARRFPWEKLILVENMKKGGR